METTRVIEAMFLTPGTDREIRQERKILDERD